MRKKSEIYISLIKHEIDWSLEHPATNLSKDFQKGFNAGLNQSIVIIEKIEEALKEEKTPMTKRRKEKDE